MQQLSTTETLRQSQPRSAWLLLGGRESCDELASFFPPPDNLLSDCHYVGTDWPKSVAAADRGPPVAAADDGRWTCGPHVEIGDKLFFYFRSPLQSIRFIATAISAPVLANNYRAAQADEITRRQWRVNFCGLVQIEPISRVTMEEVLGEKPLLLNTSCRYIRPDFANRLLDHIRIVGSRSPSHRDLAMSLVAGKKELGDPSTITLSELRGIAARDFTYEEDVERNFFEPLIRLVRLPDDVQLKRRHFVNSHEIVDYVLVCGGRPCFAMEVKRSASWPAQDWSESPDFEQASYYARELKVPFGLMDRDRIVCFALGGTEPQLTFERAEFDEGDLTAFRDVIAGCSWS